MLNYLYGLNSFKVASSIDLLVRIDYPSNIRTSSNSLLTLHRVSLHSNKPAKVSKWHTHIHIGKIKF